MAVHVEKRTTHPQPAAHRPPPPVPTAYRPVLPAHGFYYPTGHQGELFHDMVQTVQRETDAAPSLCVLTALVIGAFIQQGLVELEAPSGHITTASLIGAAAFNPTEKKSTVLDQFQKPVENYLAAYRKSQQAEHEAYASKHEQWKGTRKELIKKINKKEADAHIKKQGDNIAKYQKAVTEVETLRAALESHEQTQPQPPLPAGFSILGDATPAAFSHHIKIQKTRSMIVSTAEAEEFFTQGIKHQSSLLNKGFSGEATQKHRATRGDESHNIPMSFLLLGQPSVMEDAFGGQNNRMRGTGAIARMLFAGVPHHINRPPTHPSLAAQQGAASQILHRAETQKPSYAKNRYADWITAQLDKNVQRFHADAPRRRVTLSPAARDIWYQGRAEVRHECRPNGRYVTFEDHANRLPEQWLRVSLVLHGYNSPEDDTISAQTLATAIGLVNGFSTEFTHIFREVPQIEKDCMALEKWLDGKRADYHYIPQSMATRSGPIRSAARVKEALTRLMDLRHVNLFAVPIVNQRGHNTKPMAIINLHPCSPPNDYNIHAAVNMGRMLNHS